MDGLRLLLQFVCFIEACLFSTIQQPMIAKLATKNKWKKTIYLKLGNSQVEGGTGRDFKT